jgi:hypothetical protein
MNTTNHCMKCDASRLRRNVRLMRCRCWPDQRGAHHIESVTLTTRDVHQSQVSYLDLHTNLNSYPPFVQSLFDSPPGEALLFPNTYPPAGLVGSHVSLGGSARLHGAARRDPTASRQEAVQRRKRSSGRQIVLITS